MTRWSLFVTGAVLTVLGLALRLRGASGDLWLDEVWSLSLVRPLHSPWEVFWAIPHANNHYLNSLWMYWMGQDAPSLTYRLPAVMLGTASVPAAGLAMRRSGSAACMAAMLLVAIDYVMVEFGSQARGYSGMVFFELLAVFFAREAVAAKTARMQARAAWGMGLCLGLGFLSQFLMLLAIAGLGLWVAQVILVKARYRIKPALLETAKVFYPSALLLAPILACVAASATRFRLGNVQPFDPFAFWYAYGGMVALLAGTFMIIPAAVQASLCVMGAGLLAATRLHGEIRWFYAIFLAVVPLLFFAAAMPNSGNLRYFLPCGVVFLLGIAELFCRLFDGSPRGRAAGVALLATVILCNVATLRDFYRGGRGDYAQLVSGMGQSGIVRYGTDQPEAVRAVLGYYARKGGLALQEVEPADWCDAPPRWFIFYDGAQVPPGQMAGRMRRCGLVLTAVPFEARTISGSGWQIYRVDH